MTLRRQLLLLALSALVLPWAAWRALVQMEGLLRQGQQQALEATAEAVARSLALRPALLPPAAPAVPLHALAQAPRLDARNEDWGEVAWPLATDPAVPGLGFALGQYNERLWLLAQVRDETPARGESHWPADLAIDALLAELETSQGLLVLRLAARAEGLFSVAGADGSALPLRVEATWRETAEGYAVEAVLPQGVRLHGLRLVQVDGDGQGGKTERASARHRLYRPSPALARDWAALLPPGVRGRVLDAHGWVLAEGGALAPDASREGGTGLGRRLLYHALLRAAAVAPALPSASFRRDDRPERLAAAEGTLASRWRLDPRGTRLLLSTAMPVRVEGEVRAVLLLERSNAETLLLADRAAVHLLGLTLLAFLASAGLAFLFATRLSARIRRLRDAAEQALDRSGEVRRFPVSAARDEVGDLSRSFSRLLDEIAAYTGYLRSLASKLSHELHTPLAIVRSSLDNLDLSALPAEARPYLGRARDGVERMAQLVRSMSEATRIEQAIAAAEHEDFDLARLVAEVGEGYRALLAPRRLELALPGVLPFRGSPELVVQALDKLIDNARGFTPEAGRVAIRLRRVGRQAWLDVENTGPLLPEAMRQRLFDSLVSLRERSRDAEGAVHLGFGLHVVKLVATAHGGEAEAGNLPDGSGVVFRLRLPLP
ncbi:MAG: proteobacterial dedicated sortase system histidine kinase [Silanimonas sp.]|nr:MAG: proteobacterial dedicated sortase system histidine kinase [Silanimonas sp.]